jgi:DMSO/TMAO reductase YedYZ heme-binding membrane subunit
VSLPARLAAGLAPSAGPASHLIAAAGQAGPSPLWYATRATGVVALVLLTVTVALGVAGVSRLSSPRWPRVITAGLHRNISLLVVGFVVVHVVTTLLDPFVSINPASIVIPFISSYRPLWLSLGTIAFDLILALVATSLLRTRMSVGTWRTVHWLAYACWPVALWHGLGTGTDSKVPWLLLLDAACVLLVAGALLWRLQELPPGLGRTAAMAGTVLVPVATVVFVVIGPLRPHWAERAGTPAALLGRSVVTGPTADPAANPAGTPAAGTAGSGWTGFTGRATIARPRADQEIITVHAHTSGADQRSLTVVLRGTPEGHGISMAAGSVRLVPAAGGAAWSGPVTTLSGTRLDAALHSAGGATEQARLTLVLRGATASGQVFLSPAVTQ